MNKTLLVFLALVCDGCVQCKTDSLADIFGEQQCNTSSTCAQYLKKLMQANWRCPPGSKNGMEVLIQVNLDDRQNLIGASVINSSGETSFDESALSAVHRSSPFSALKGLPANVFDNSFRKFNFQFKTKALDTPDC